MTAANGASFSQRFSRAYMSRSDDGEYRIALVDEPLDENRSPDANAISPAPSTPLRQIVLIHVFWRPMDGVKPDHPSATNAAIDWYILPAGVGGSTDLLHYKGAGYVRVFDDSVDIANASVTPATLRGAMTDPLGPAALEGSARAIFDPARVRAIAAELAVLDPAPAPTFAAPSAAAPPVADPPVTDPPVTAPTMIAPAPAPSTPTPGAPPRQPIGP